MTQQASLIRIDLPDLPRVQSDTALYRELEIIYTAIHNLHYALTGVIAGTPSSVWGTLTGTLANQTDLQTALNAKISYSGATSDINMGAHSVIAAHLISSNPRTINGVVFAGDVDITLIARVFNAASAATLTPNVTLYDEFVITALAAPLTIAAPSTAGSAGQAIVIRINDDGTARALTWNAIYRQVGTTLPNTTVAGKIAYFGFIYNSTASKWDLVAVSQEA